MFKRCNLCPQKGTARQILLMFPPHYCPDQGPQLSHQHLPKVRDSGHNSGNTGFPPPSLNFIPKWNPIHWIRATLGFVFITGMPALCWALLGSGNTMVSVMDMSPLSWGWHSSGRDNKQGNKWIMLKSHIGHFLEPHLTNSRDGEEHPLVPYLMNSPASSNWKWGTFLFGRACSIPVTCPTCREICFSLFVDSWKP